MGSGPYSTLCVWSCCIEERGHLPLLRNDVLSHISSQSGVSSAPWVKTQQHTQAHWYYKKTKPNAPVLLHQHTEFAEERFSKTVTSSICSLIQFEKSASCELWWEKTRVDSPAHPSTSLTVTLRAQLILRPALFLSKYYCTDFTVQQLTCGFSCRNILL